MVSSVRQSSRRLGGGELVDQARLAHARPRRGWPSLARGHPPPWPIGSARARALPAGPRTASSRPTDRALAAPVRSADTQAPVRSTAHLPAEISNRRSRNVPAPRHWPLSRPAPAPPGAGRGPATVSAWTRRRSRSASRRARSGRGPRAGRSRLRLLAVGLARARCQLLRLPLRREPRGVANPRRDRGQTPRPGRSASALPRGRRSCAPWR